MRLIISSLILFVATGPLTACADQAVETEPNAIESILSELDFENAPGVAIGVIQNGEIIIEAYRGLANLEYGIPIDEYTRFNIASNAKQYTALMILELAEQGALNLEVDFRTYLSDALPEIEQTISVENLLTHTSGVRDIYDLWALTGVTWYERPFRNRDAMALLNQQTDLNFTPGSKKLYSNSNYILLAEVIAEITGKRFHEYANEFFAARSMPNTSLRRRAGVVVPRLARPYGNWSGWLEYPAIANMHGDGFVYTTLRDQLAWEKQIQGADQTLADDVIARSQILVSSTLTETYGYGLEFGNYKGLTYTYHIGNTGAYNAYLMRFPSEDTAIVVMGNTTEVGVVNLGRKVADAILAERLEEEAFPTAPETVQPKPENDTITGIYEASDVGIILVTETNGELYAEIQGNKPGRLLNEQGNIYTYEPSESLKLVFETDITDGKTLTLYNGQQVPIVVVYRQPIPTALDYASGLEGRYINTETDTEIIIEHVEGSNFQVTKNGRARDGNLIAGDYLGMNSYRIGIVRNAEGRITGLSVDNNRIQDVWFELGN